MDVLAGLANSVTLGEIVIIAAAIVTLLFLKFMFIRQLRKIQADFKKVSEDLRNDLDGRQKDLRDQFMSDFDEMSDRLTNTSDSVKELITDLDGRTTNLLASMTSLERALNAHGAIQLPSGRIATTADWSTVKEGYDDLKKFLKARAGGIHDGRRRKRYEDRDWRSLAGIIDDLEFDRTLSADEAEAARTMNRLFVSLRFRPNEISAEDLARFSQLKQQAINSRL